MTQTRFPRWLALLCLAVFCSGWLPLPIPVSWLPAEIDVAGTSFRIQLESVHVVWARGRLQVQDLQVDVDGKRLLATPAAEIHLGLLPLTDNFLRAHDLRLKNPQLNIDSRLLASLQSQQTRPNSPGILNLDDLPNLAFQITGGRLQWTQANGQVLLWEVEDLRGLLTPERSDVQLDGRMLAPVQSDVRAIATSEDFFKSWRFQIQGQNGRDRDAWIPQEIPTLRGLEVAPGNYSFKFAAASEPGQELASLLELNLENARVSVADPPLVIEGLQLHANGGLREGVHVEIQGTVDNDFKVHANGRFQLPKDSPPWLHIRGNTTSVQVDQDRLDWVRLLHPITADILEALEARGGPEARVALNWQQGSPTAWAVHADTAGMTMRYRGILTREGEKPAFPYPVQATRGDFVATDRFLLINVAARAGMGQVLAGGVVEIYPERTALHIDVEANRVRIDGTVRSAVTGMPILAAIWKDLGIPRGGDADIDIRIRTEDAQLDTGIEIFGTVHGTQIRPPELPIPTLVEELQFHWTPGLTTFDGSLLAAQSRLQIEGKIREAIDSEFPSVQAHIQGKDLAPDWSSRQILTDRLELPSWLALGALEGRSQFELLYNQPGGTESPQLLMDFSGKGGKLTWGTKLGPSWFPMLTLNQLQATYSLVSSRYQHRGGIPHGKMQFSNRQMEFSMLEGTETEQDGLLLSAQQVHTPEPVFKALLALLKADHLLGPLNAECWSDILLEWRGNAKNPLHARFGLDPLILHTPSGEEPISMHGELTVADGTLQAPYFRLEQGSGRIELRDVVFHFGQDRQQFKATLDSAQGIRLDSDTYHLLGPQAAEALSQIGLVGELRPRKVKLNFYRDGDGPGVLDIRNGRIDIREVGFEAPVALSNGRASVLMEQLRWTSDQGIFARLNISEGSANVAGLPINSGSANIAFTPESIILTDLEAFALGGSIRTRIPAPNDAAKQTSAKDEDKNTIPGKLQLGLTAEAPLQAQFSIKDLELDRIGEQFGVEPKASGKLSGWVKINSPTLSPLDFKGRGEMKIRQGRLSKVPMLEQIWDAVGITPPVFREGEVRFRLNGDSRVRIQELQLDHDLLDIQGKGWIHMDGSMQLKLGLRQVRIFLGIPLTDLPLIRNLLDLFTEQDVYGPIDNLAVTTRSIRKIFGQELPRPPFPLWLPERPRHAPGKSPVLPPATKP